MSSDASLTPSPLRLLAIDTSTDRMSVAVGGGGADGELLSHAGPGAAQSSTTLLPVVSALLAKAGWPLHTLSAIAFARGPGSFTGLRTACAAAQGLAYGTQGLGREGGVPVLPVDSLLAVAEEARWLQEQAGAASPGVILAMLDARMTEMYVAVYAVGTLGLNPVALAGPCLCAPHQVGEFLAGVADPLTSRVLLAGNAFEAYGDALAAVPGERQTAWPTAQALLRLAPRLMAAGHTVAAHDAMPLYVRDKVAQTTDEREKLRLAQLAQTLGLENAQVQVQVQVPTPQPDQ